MSESPRALLEARLVVKPGSPALVRLAYMNLDDGRIDEALKLGLEGRKRFPTYATVNLLLGQCFRAMGKTLEALLEFRKALEALPDNFAVRALVSEMEVRRLSDYRLFAESRKKDAAEPQGRSFEEFVSGVAIREAPAPEEVPVVVKEVKKPETATEVSSRIVTPTLAEIYASQGEYKEAITAYRRLMERRPDDAERFSIRVAELEVLARRQDEEGKTREDPA